jgi:hypothetical protein
MLMDEVVGVKSDPRFTGPLRVCEEFLNENRVPLNGRTWPGWLPD